MFWVLLSFIKGRLINHRLTLDTVNYRLGFSIEIRFKSRLRRTPEATPDIQHEADPICFQLAN